MRDTVKVTLEFKITNEKLLKSRAEEAVALYGGGVSVSNDAREQIVEVLLHSNPGVESYDRYGLELV